MEQKMRLQKAIANSGYCSRRKAEEIILAGKVKVNGETITELGVKVGKKDVRNYQRNREIRRYWPRKR